MAEKTRRDFVKHGALGAISAATLGRAKTGRAAKASRQLNLGVIGCGGRWQSLAALWAKQDGLRIRYLCDVDRRVLETAAQERKWQRDGDFDGEREQVPNDEEANALLRRQYRAHWAAPQNA
jgi:hypothetical protein